MIADCIRKVRERLGRVVIEGRLDSAFLVEKILRFLMKFGVLYAVKMPIWKWTGVKELSNHRERWSVATEYLSWGQRVRWYSWTSMVTNSMWSCAENFVKPDR